MTSKAFPCCLVALALVAEVGCVTIPAGTHQREIGEPDHPVVVDVERKLVVGFFPGIGTSWAHGGSSVVGSLTPAEALIAVPISLVVINGVTLYIPTLVAWFWEPFTEWGEGSLCVWAVVGFCKVGLKSYDFSEARGHEEVTRQTDDEKSEAVESGLRALFGEEAKISRYEPEGAYGHGFAVLLPDGRRFDFEVTDEYWADHTPAQLADKMREDDLEKKLTSSSYKWHILSNQGLISEQTDWR